MMMLPRGLSVAFKHRLRANNAYIIINDNAQANNPSAPVLQPPTPFP
jgi:hypothetical protein